MILSGIQKKRKRGTYRALGPKELYKACCNLVKGQGGLYLQVFPPLFCSSPVTMYVIRGPRRQSKPKRPLLMLFYIVVPVWFCHVSGGTQLFFQICIHFVDFLPFYTREATFVTSCMSLSTPKPFWKGSTLKGKNLLPWEANSFFLELKPSQKGNFDVCLRSFFAPITRQEKLYYSSTLPHACLALFLLAYMCVVLIKLLYILHHYHWCMHICKRAVIGKMAAVTLWW